MEQHQGAVKALSNRLASLYQTKQPYRVYHGSTNSTRNYKVARSTMVDTSRLDHVIKVDTAAKTAIVEPNVPMDRLVEETLKHGLVPPVVMEFPGITVGGGYSGTSGESSSFKHGFFDSTINWVEFILPNGEIVTASDKERSDLFYGAAGAFGTLGVATLFELNLIEAKTYVEVTYWPWTSSSTTLAAADEAAEDSTHDYVDGIIFAKDRGVTIVGQLTNSIASTTRVQTFSKSSDPWFYLHVEKVTRKAQGPVVEAIPLRDYLFRYDRGAFWTGKYAFEYFSTPFNRVTRWALDGLMKTRRMYHALHASGLGQQYIIQDLALPISRAQQFIEYVELNFGAFPLWLCPLQAPLSKSMHPHAHAPAGSDDEEKAVAENEPLMNVGLWCPGPSDYEQFVEVNRQLEKKVQSLGGMKWLYAQAFYTEDEFWQNFDKEWYDGLRKKYYSDHLPNVYDKVKANTKKGGPVEQSAIKKKILSTAPLNGIYGVAHLMLKKDYLLSKK